MDPSLGLVTLTAFCLPFLILEETEWKRYKDTNSPIYSAMASDANRNCIYVLIGICIPVTIDYILDIFYYGSMDKESGYIHRGILLINALVPNLIILCYIIPHKSPIYIPLLYQIRCTVALFCVLAYLYEFGSAVANGKIFFLLCLASVISIVMRLFTSMSSLTIFSTLFTISIFLLTVMLLIFTFKWVQYIRKKQPKSSLSIGHIICSVYLLVVLVCLMSLIVLRLGFGSLIHADSSSTDLITHQSVMSVFLLTLVMVHSRMLHFKMNRTQAIINKLISFDYF